MCDPDCDIISNDVPKMGWSSGKAINPSCRCKSHLSLSQFGKPLMEQPVPGIQAIKRDRDHGLPFDGEQFPLRE